MQASPSAEAAIAERSLPDQKTNLLGQTEPISKPAAKPESWQRGGSLDLEEPADEAGSNTLVVGLERLGPDLHPVADEAFAQIQRTIRWFQSQLRLSALPIRTVSLCGGVSYTAGLSHYWQQRFKVPVHQWQPQGIMAELGEEAPHYALAMGLALSRDPMATQLDLRPESVQRQDALQRTIYWPRYAAAIIIIAGLLFAWGSLRRQAVIEERVALYNDQRSRYQSLEGDYSCLKQTASRCSMIFMVSLVGYFVVVIYYTRSVRSKNMRQKSCGLRIYRPFPMNRTPALHVPVAVIDAVVRVARPSRRIPHLLTR